MEIYRVDFGPNGYFPPSSFLFIWPSCQFSAFRFSIYSAFWIRPNGSVRKISSSILFYFIYWAQIKKNILCSDGGKRGQSVQLREYMFYIIMTKHSKKFIFFLWICSFVFFDSGLPPRLSGSA